MGRGLPGRYLSRSLIFTPVLRTWQYGGIAALPAHGKSLCIYQARDHSGAYIVHSWLLTSSCAGDSQQSCDLIYIERSPYEKSGDNMTNIGILTFSDGRAFVAEEVDEMNWRALSAALMSSWQPTPAIIFTPSMETGWLNCARSPRCLASRRVSMGKVNEGAFL